MSEDQPSVIVGPSLAECWEEKDIITRDAVLFSPRMATAIEPSNGTWNIVDRGDGHLINLAPFYGDDINYLALTCYHLKQQDERGEPRDIVGAARLAGRDSSHDDEAMMDFMIEFTVAMVELVDR